MANRNKVPTKASTTLTGARKRKYDEERMMEERRRSTPKLERRDPRNVPAMTRAQYRELMSGKGGTGDPDAMLGERMNPLIEAPMFAFGGLPATVKSTLGAVGLTVGTMAGLEKLAESSPRTVKLVNLGLLALSVPGIAASARRAGIKQLNDLVSEPTEQKLKLLAEMLKAHKKKHNLTGVDDKTIDLALKGATRELDRRRPQAPVGKSSDIQIGKNVQNLLKWVPPKQAFQSPVRTGATPKFNQADVEAWLSDIETRFGAHRASAARKFLYSPEFAAFEYPTGFQQLSAQYTKMRNLTDQVAEPGEILLAGSPAIASEGSIFRQVAAPHDLDFTALVGGASGKPYIEIPVVDQIARLSSAENIEASPVFAKLREKIPALKNAKFRHAKVDYEFDHDPNGVFNTDARYDPSYFTIPTTKPNVSKGGRVTRLVTTKIDGEKVDIMLSDAGLELSAHNPRMSAAEVANDWKRTYTRHGKPREKDLPDLTGYRPYSDDNLMIDPYTGQSRFASFMFPENSYLTEKGLPRVVEMPIRPGDPEKVPVIMNDRGEILQLDSPETALYPYTHPGSAKLFYGHTPSYGWFTEEASAQTHPVVAIRGTKSLGDEAAPSIGLYPARNVDQLVDDMLTPRPGNWATNKEGGFNNVYIYPRAVIDPRYNPRTALFHKDAFTLYAPNPSLNTNRGKSARQLADDYKSDNRDAPRGDWFAYGGKLAPFPELGSQYRSALYASNPASHFAGHPSLSQWKGYGESKAALTIPADDAIIIPSEFFNRPRDEVKRTLVDLINKMKFSVPVGATGLGAATLIGGSEDEVHQDAKGGDTRRDIRTANGAGDTNRWTWEKYRWNPRSKGGRIIDPKNIKGTGIAFDPEKNRLTVPKGREKDFEAYMDKLANPPKTVVLDNGQEVPVKSFLVPRDWRTNTEYNKDYDYVAAFLGGVEPSPVDHGKDGWILHMNDVGKMPTHPTFSKDSYYARDPKYAPLAGEWKGETYIPGEAERSVRQAAGAGDTEGPEVPVEEPVPQPAEPVPEGGPRIVINPEVFEDKRDALCVAMNEAFRVLMEVNGFNPVSEPTDAQRQFFADTAYSQNENQMRRTILARICTFDTSVKDPTEEQLEESVEFLETVMEMGAPQNEWEQQAVQRIHDVLVAAIEKGASVGDTPTEEPPAPEDVQEGDPRGEQAAVGGGVSVDILPTLKQLGFLVDSGSRHTPYGARSY